MEALQSGVYRCDIPNEFKLDPAAYQGLIDKIDRSLTFALEVEAGIQRAEVTNYEEVCSYVPCHVVLDEGSCQRRRISEIIVCTGPS